MLAVARTTRPWWIAAGALAACAAVAALDPTRAGGPTLCPFRAVTGRDCPACGATRATWALVHGDVARAAGFNALFVALMPLALWAWVLDARGRFETSSHPFRRAAFWWALVAVAVAFTIVRNLLFADALRA